MTGKRVYVAAPWRDRDVVLNGVIALEQAGYTVTQKWWIFEGEEENTDWEFKKLCAKLDWDGVRSADAVVLYNTTKSEGKAIEQGMAIAYGIPIIVIGDKDKDRTSIFQTLDCYHWVPNIEHAVIKLKELQIEPRNETIFQTFKRSY